MDSVSKQEGLVDQYLNEGNKDAAVKLLYELIVEHANKRILSGLKHSGINSLM
jgi:hypothetical protein